MTLDKKTFESMLKLIEESVKKMEATFDISYKKVKETGADMGQWMWIGHELAHMKYSIGFKIVSIKAAIVPTYTIPAENITVSYEAKFNG